jgi:dTDP-4-amino-4,6-dideoxygalactose transaminase
MHAINAIARGRRLFVIEDAAHGLPASYRGQRIGGGNNPVAFSFYATKNMTTAEGGMLTGDPAFLERARMLSLHGLSKDARTRYQKGGSWRYDILAPGFKYNMTDIQASLGVCQLRKLESFQARRRAVIEAYRRAFEGEEAFDLPVSRPEVGHAWHLFVLRLRPGVLRIDRDEFINQLTHRNIGTSVHFIPIHLHPYYRAKYGFRPTAFPVAYQNFRRMISLPLNPRLRDSDVQDVIDAVLDVVHTFRR